MNDPFDACRVAYEQGQRDVLARLDAYLAGCNCPHVDGARAAIKGDQP